MIGPVPAVQLARWLQTRDKTRHVHDLKGGLDVVPSTVRHPGVEPRRHRVGHHVQVLAKHASVVAGSLFQVADKSHRVDQGLVDVHGPFRSINALDVVEITPGQPGTHAYTHIKKKTFLLPDATTIGQFSSVGVSFLSTVRVKWLERQKTYSSERDGLQIGV